MALFPNCKQRGDMETLVIRAAERSPTQPEASVYLAFSACGLPIKPLTKLWRRRTSIITSLLIQDSKRYQIKFLELDFVPHSMFRTSFGIFAQSEREDATCKSEYDKHLQQDGIGAQSVEGDARDGRRETV